MDSKKILLHTCCAPCAGGATERVLNENWEPTLYYANSNIFPEEEFYKRLSEAEKLAAYHDIQLIVEPYNHKEWLKVTSELAKEPEGGARCGLCFGYNLELTAHKAMELGFQHFTTTLSISPYKNFTTLSNIGSRYPTFQAIDFKKQGGYQRSVEIARAMNFYRQNYCGCEFSMR